MFFFQGVLHQLRLSYIPYHIVYRLAIVSTSWGLYGVCCMLRSRSCPSAASRRALCPVRTPAPVAAQPGSVCPAGTVRNVMGIVRGVSSVRHKHCDRYLSSVPDGRPRLSRHRPIGLR